MYQQTIRKTSNHNTAVFETFSTIRPDAFLTNENCMSAVAKYSDIHRWCFDQAKLKTERETINYL